MESRWSPTDGYLAAFLVLLAFAFLASFVGPWWLVALGAVGSLTFLYLFLAETMLEDDETSATDGEESSRDEIEQLQDAYAAGRIDDDEFARGGKSERGRTAEDTSLEGERNLE
ncbi:hypothetical protein AB7C87_15125 [Natrarchaeobius sp. A-rgal3]|uniref:hypothetical protein n=1 Tax=Natrarchaeobius versutus TaxID=1679078 RepID=UPI0035102C0C